MKPALSISTLLGTLMLAGCLTTPGTDTGLVDKDWIIEDISGRGVIDNARATLNFGQDGRVTGDTSCNRYFADYKINGSMLSIGQAGVTRKACVPAVMDQEQRFLEVMNAVDQFRIDGTGALILSTPAGATVTARTSTSAK